MHAAHFWLIKSTREFSYQANTQPLVYKFFFCYSAREALGKQFGCKLSNSVCIFYETPIT